MFDHANRETRKIELMAYFTREIIRHRDMPSFYKDLDMRSSAESTVKYAEMLAIEILNKG